ncbi:MAG: glycogen debranching protein GlgX [Phycisphaerae bacterium]|nr:glycogen debranching protein GlgX [Phycisphaerae bacterium]
MRVWPGKPYPLGATYDGRGTNFSLFTESAQAVKLCLFDNGGQETQIELPESTEHCRHGYLPDVAPGQRYGYRVHGPYDPASGQRANPAKLLLDPYAKAIEGQVQWNPAVYGHNQSDPDGPPNLADSAPFMPRCIVINPYFDWRHDAPPDATLHESVIYELHVKGFTMRHPDVPPELRGTYAGLAHPAVIDYLTDLGVTAVELMPVHEFIHAQRLLEKGLRNYWGYDTINFFAPHHEYASPGPPGRQVQQFKQMVLALHQARIEVILDVVYTHTPEGNHLGPTLAYKGIDNVSYYRLVTDHRGRYYDTTGTGNSFNMNHPNVLRMIMDSLRYWITEMHVDGFRFDLAPTLARELHEVDRLSAFFDIIHQDPVISQAKLIAEPWDVGDGGHQVGKFPVQWCEWNALYRDDVRKFWRGDPGTRSEFARRFTGSAELYEKGGRPPYASVNFVTCHDGYTLRDLVSYSHGHNEANQEDDRGREEYNISFNCGHEGHTDDPEVNMRRSRYQRDFLATLLLSQGMPHILHGDEIGRTQHGNNNAYSQDNDTSYVDWEHRDCDLHEFAQRLIALRRDHPIFRRWRWIRGSGTGQPAEVAWYQPNGQPMTDEQWDRPDDHALQIMLDGNHIRGLDLQGQPISDDSFLVLVNAHHEPLAFRIIPGPTGGAWFLVLDTSDWQQDDRRSVQAGEEITMPASSLLLFTDGQ